MIVFWVIGVLFLVVGLIVCVPRYRMFLKYKGRASGKIIKIETNGKTNRAIFEYSVGKRIYRQHTGWTSNGIFVVGNHCSVVYSFKDPQRSYIKNSGQLIQCIVSTVFVIIGIVALCLGYILQGVL